MNIKKLSAVQIKKYCTAEQFAAMSENDLVEMFRQINSRIFALQDSLKLQDLVEMKWWENAYKLLDKELCKRKICLTYIATAPGTEGKFFIELLKGDESAQEDACAMIDQLQLHQLKNVESELVKIVHRNPHLYQPYLEQVREAIASKNGTMIN